MGLCWSLSYQVSRQLAPAATPPLKGAGNKSDIEGTKEGQERPLHYFSAEKAHSAVIQTLWALIKVGIMAGLVGMGAGTWPKVALGTCSRRGRMERSIASNRPVWTAVS